MQVCFFKSTGSHCSSPKNCSSFPFSVTKLPRQFDRYHLMERDEPAKIDEGDESVSRQARESVSR